MSIKQLDPFKITCYKEKNPQIAKDNQYSNGRKESQNNFFALTDITGYSKDKNFSVANVKIEQSNEIKKLPSIISNKYTRSETQKQSNKLFAKENYNCVYNRKLNALIKTKKIKNNFEKNDILENAMIFMKSQENMQSFIICEQLNIIINKLKRSMRLIHHKKHLVEIFKEKINKIKDIETNMKKINRTIDISHMTEFESLKDILELYGATSLIKKHFNSDAKENDSSTNNIKQIKMDNLFLLLKVLITVLLLINELCRMMLYFYRGLPDLDKEKYEIIDKEIKLDLHFFQNYFHLFEFVSFKLNQNFEILFEIYEIFKFQTQIQKIKVKKICEINKAKYFCLIIQNARINLEELHYRIFNFDELIKI